MEEYLFVVERLEWSDNLENRDFWEDRHLCVVCQTLDEAKAFVEENAQNAGVPMRWRGDLVYSGRNVVDGETEYGLRYEIHSIRTLH